MSDTALLLRDLKKTYPPSGRKPPTEALRGVSLEIPRGEIFALLGPNGAGKSTIINILTGLARKTGGEAKVFGFDVQEEHRDARFLMGVVPQEIVIDPFFSVAGELDIMAGLHGVPEEKRWNKELLERLSLTPHAGANPRTLSGGMKRRLLVAKALVHRPEFLILDEPTAGVDVELRNALWKFVRELNEERGTTVLLTTHHMLEAEQMAHRIGIMAKGEIKAIDTLEGLKRIYGKPTLEEIYLEVTKDTSIE